MSERPIRTVGKSGRLALYAGAQASSLPDALLVDEARCRDLRYLRRHLFSVADEQMPDLEAIGDVLLSRRYGGGRDVVAHFEDGAIALMQARRGSVVVEVAAASLVRADALCEALAERLGATQEAEDEVSMHFWALARNGARAVRRRVPAPDWSEIAGNYGRETALAVARLITARVPESGRLILWHGPPGAGKTHALRALSRVWSEWCSTHYITDPEAFLGHGTSYLLDVLTAEDSARAVSSRWKLIVLEDSGELLSVDAHERTGQALSRLLNTTDGVLGQGTRAIVLVTTNEPLGRLHPAIQRPGRCWAKVEFRELDCTEANCWLASHDSAMRVTGPTSLADLYAVLRGRQPDHARPFGFAAAGSQAR